MLLLKTLFGVAMRYKQLSLSLALVLTLLAAYNVWMSGIKTEIKQEAVVEVADTITQQTQQQIKAHENIIKQTFDPPVRTVPSAIDRHTERLFVTEPIAATRPAANRGDRDRLQRPRNDPVDTQRRSRPAARPENSQMGIPDRLRPEEVDFILRHSELLQQVTVPNPQNTNN